MEIIFAGQIRIPAVMQRASADHFEVLVNQHDVEERNKQVVLMGSVCMLAHHTVIYLGEGTVGSNAALETLTGEKYIW